MDSMRDHEDGKRDERGCRIDYTAIYRLHTLRQKRILENHRGARPRNHPGARG